MGVRSKDLTLLKTRRDRNRIFFFFDFLKNWVIKPL